MAQARGMALREVHQVLATVAAVGCRCWLEGGWGVDALVGRQTRPHRDVDIDAAYQAPVLLALYERGYRIETDWRPNRVEPYFTLGRLGGRRVPCFTVEAQCLFHTGYELRDVDRHDLGLLDALRPC